MNNSEPESGYIGGEDAGCYVGSAMRDVEVIRVTATNVIARGYRYGRQWFLKGLREEFRHCASMLHRLQKEFEIHSRLRHPNIVQAVGFEEITGLGPCIIQEWVDGTTLYEVLRDGNLTADERRKVMHELTEAVAYLHRRGVVHRDIKPSNVMIRKTGGETVLIDFGMADSDDYVENKEPAGTRGFISPEQLESGGVNTTDDVYSMGIVMRGLCPRYQKIADKCTGPARRRPNDAGELLKALVARDRRPKIVVAVIVTLALVSVAVAVSLRIISLQRNVEQSRQQISILNEKNAGNETRVTMLHDSLTEIHGKLASTQQELADVKEYETLRQNSLNEGCRRIDKVLKDYDSRVFSKFEPSDSHIFTDSIINLLNKLTETVQNYTTELAKTSLQTEDAEKIRMDLYNYQAINLSQYQKQWMKKIHPEQ